MILGPDGMPVDPAAHTSTPIAEVADGLPEWVQGVAYRAADDVITLRANVPASPWAHAHLLALEMTPESCEALLAALQRVLSHRQRPVLDVPSEPAPSGATR